MYKSAFANKKSIINYFDSCIYNQVELSKLPDYQLHNVTLILLIKYKKITHFIKLNLSAKQIKLLVISQNNII